MTTGEQLKRIRRFLDAALSEAQKLQKKKSAAVYVSIAIGHALLAVDHFEKRVDACPRCGSREEICPC